MLVVEGVLVTAVPGVEAEAGVVEAVWVVVRVLSSFEKAGVVREKEAFIRNLFRIALVSFNSSKRCFRIFS